MASGSSRPSSRPPLPVLCASFNQDCSLFTIGTREGFKIVDTRTGQIHYEKNLGALSIVEMLLSSSLVAIVGAGEQPELSPRRLCLFNTATGAAMRELNFLTSVLAVRINRKRLIVILLEKTFIYDLNRMSMLDEVDTVPNPRGLCAFAPYSVGCHLALPASSEKGSVLVYNATEFQSICQIDAHVSPLAALAFSHTGMHLASASEKGTIIRVHLITQATKSYSFRRGTYSSTIYSLTFSPPLDVPEFVVATSSSGSCHIFSLAIASNERSHVKLLGPISEALDSSNHHVIHNVVPAGVRSFVAAFNAEDTGKAAPPLAPRARICIIAQHGYFYEYLIRLNTSSESSWMMEREFSLIAAPAEASR